MTEKLDWEPVARRRKTLDDEDDFKIPAPRPLAPGQIDRDLVREYRCFMCGRDAPPLRPRACPSCGGNWLMAEEYIPRYG